jgi:predicted GNAT family acetyltransferase
VNTEISHEPDAARYVMRSGGQIVSVLDYADRPDAISFTHTFTNPAYRGRGLAAELVGFAVDDVESTTQKRIVPMCWFVSDWFQAHPARAGLLSR